MGKLVLGGAGKGDVTGDSPDASGVFHIFGGGHIVHIGLDAVPLDLLDELDGAVVDTVLIHDIAVGVAHGHHLGSHLAGLFAGVDSHVA